MIQYKTLDELGTQDQIVGKDISEGGVCFTVYERLAKGTDLDLQIQAPFDSMPMFVKGKVAWIRKIGEEHEKIFEVGVKFLKGDPRDEKRLKMYINEEIKEKKTSTE